MKTGVEEGMARLLKNCQIHPHALYSGYSSAVQVFEVSDRNY